MPSHMEQRTSVTAKWGLERDRGGGGGGRGLTLIQVGKRKEVKKEQEGMQRRGKGGDGVTKHQLEKTTLSTVQQRWEAIGQEAVTYRWTRSRARMHTNTVSVVTQACINNVAERNRMQILPYIRVYRGLAGSEQPLSFSALPSGWMYTRFPELINHHICHPNNFSRWLCCNKGMRAMLKSFLTSVHWL